jgi:single-strand DNA-binding protein
MINKVVLIGRLGRDPEMRYTNTGTPVANFSMATDEVWGKDKERQRKTEWHNIVVWSRLAEICNQYLRKGKLVYIEGRLQTREWEDRDGNKRRTTEIVASEMKMLDGPGESQEYTKEPAAVSVGEESQTMETGITDDDIPF